MPRKAYEIKFIIYDSVFIKNSEKLIGYEINLKFIMSKILKCS